MCSISTKRVNQFSNYLSQFELIELAVFLTHELKELEF